MTVINVSKKEVDYLNSLDDVKKFPSKFKRPILGKNVGIIERKQTGGKCAYAIGDIKENEVVCYSNASVINKPIKYSWQIGKDMHLIGPGAFDHKCQTANCGIDDSNNLIALNDICKGELLTFNYLTTELEMNTPFKCICGDKGCYGFIKGFKFLNDEQRKELKEHFPLSSFIKLNFFK